MMINLTSGERGTKSTKSVATDRLLKEVGRVGQAGEETTRRREGVNFTKILPASFAPKNYRAHSGVKIEKGRIL